MVHLNHERWRKREQRGATDDRWIFKSLNIHDYEANVLWLNRMDFQKPIDGGHVDGGPRPQRVPD